MTNRRSRNRLAFSHDVSDANVQKWHAAPCRKSSGASGSLWAQIGSEEHRLARRRAPSTRPSMVVGSLSSTSPPNVPSLSGAVVLTSTPAAGGRSALAGHA